METVPINILIIASEVTKGMKSIGSKSLLKLKNSTLVIEHQIKELKRHYKNSTITISTGFESEKMIKALSAYDVKFIYNEEYQTTNQAKSLIDYIQNSIPEQLLIINSGILFKNIFTRNTYRPGVFILDKPKADFNIGCNIDTDAFYLFYDLPHRWSECMLLSKKELLSLRDLSKQKNLEQLYLFEIMNLLSDKGSLFEKHIISKTGIMKISHVKDLTRARSFV